MTTDEKSLETMLFSTPEERHDYFIQQVIETGEIWALCGEGWATFQDDAQGFQLFPIWSNKASAAMNIEGEWQAFEPRSFTIQQLIDELAPTLEQANIYFSLFKMPTDSGLIVSSRLVVKRLQERLDAKL